jgi:hypothetical protein
VHCYKHAIPSGDCGRHSAWGNKNTISKTNKSAKVLVDGKVTTKIKNMNPSDILKAVKNGKFNTLKGFEATLNDAETDIWYSSGTYGIVFRLRHKREKKLYALKVLKESTPELLEPCEAPSEAKPVRWRPRRARPSY